VGHWTETTATRARHNGPAEADCFEQGWLAAWFSNNRRMAAAQPGQFPQA